MSRLANSDRPRLPKRSYDIRRPRRFYWSWRSRPALALYLLPLLWFLASQQDPRHYVLTRLKVPGAPWHLPIETKPGQSLSSIALFLDGPQLKYYFIIFNTKRLIPSLLPTEAGTLSQRDSLTLLLPGQTKASQTAGVQTIRWQSASRFELKNKQGLFYYQRRRPSIIASFSFMAGLFPKIF